MRGHNTDIISKRENSMRWVAEIKTPRVLECRIYDTVWKNMRDQSTLIQYALEIDDVSGKSWDYMQDTLQQAKAFALEKFQVPLEAWVQVS